MDSQPRIRGKFEFNSKSDQSKIYVVLLYDNGVATCNCPGWTRRVDVYGNRHCRHTDEVLSRVPETAPAKKPVITVSPRAKAAVAPKPKPQPINKPEAIPGRIARRFDL